MARGWESKSVESQIEEASGAQPKGHNHPLTEADKHRKRERENLILARARVLQLLEASSNERYKELLHQELSELERKLESN